MNHIDLTRPVLSPSGVELAAMDSLENASAYLNESDTDCAYVRAARGLLEAVLSDIRRQAAPEVTA